MENKTTDAKGKWLQGKAFYGVAALLLLAVCVTVAAIFNVASGTKRPKAENSPSIFTVTETTESTADYRANLNATGVPDERSQSQSTEEKSVANDLNMPYSGYYLLPLNSRVIKDFSNGEMVFSETMNDWRTHDGIDVKGNVGDSVIAIQDGKVTDVYDDALWGCVIEIKHGNGLSATYCGVKSGVKKGDKVEQGQVIGTLTEIPTEKSGDKHLHLETYVDGKAVDPVKAMNLMNSDDRTVAE